MKKIISGLLLFSAVTAFAQDTIKFEDLPFKDLIAKAKKEKRLSFWMPMLHGAVRAK